MKVLWRTSSSAAGIVCRRRTGTDLDGQFQRPGGCILLQVHGDEEGRIAVKPLHLGLKFGSNFRSGLDCIDSDFSTAAFSASLMVVGIGGGGVERE